MKIKEKLKLLRKQNNYTQEEIAKLLNISAVGYGDYERGKSTPDIYTLKKITVIYKMTLDEFMKDTDDQSINVCITENEIKALESIIKKINNSKKLNELNRSSSTNNIQIGNFNTITNNFDKK